MNEKLEKEKKHAKREARKWDVVETVHKQTTPETRLPVALDALADDMAELIEHGTKEEQRAAIAAFRADRHEFVAMIFES